MEVINISEYEEEVVIHFGGDRAQINAYTLASTLVSLADAAKEANSIVNPGYEVEIVVEAFKDGSFRAKLKTVYRGLDNLLTAKRLEAIVLGVITAFIFQHTLASDSDVKIIINDKYVVIEQNDKKIIIPKNVYEAQKEVEKSENFKNSVSRTFKTVESDSSITEFGITKNLDDKIPEIIVPRERFARLSSTVEVDALYREIQEVADLQISRAILKKSKRKWEFIWRGVTISAPVLDENFYREFFAHNITIAPGDSFEALLKIYQTRDENTGIYTNSKYEIVKVIRHIPRLTQTEIDI